MFRIPGAPRLAPTGAIALIFVVSACSRPSATSPTPIATQSVATPVGSTSFRTLSLGEVAVGRVTAGSPTCTYSTSDGEWGGLCQTFEVMAPGDGALVADVTSSQLAVFAKTAGGQQIDMNCCGGGRLVFPVKSGAAYHVELAYFGRPPGYPSISPADYRIVVSTATSSNAQTVKLRVYDTGRSQQVSTAHVEVTGGPGSGSAATFNRSTGMYTLAAPAPGYVTVAVSAPGFIDQRAEIPVGTSAPAEVFLTRDSSLPSGSAQLVGSTYASASHNQLWTGALVEIVDGPLAGEFAFSDEMGMVTFNGLPLGPVRVRASYGGSEQTLTITVTPLTIVGFELY